VAGRRPRRSPIPRGVAGRYPRGTASRPRRSSAIARLPVGAGEHWVLHHAPGRTVVGFGGGIPRDAAGLVQPDPFALDPLVTLAAM
jgi:hypothetical protein